MGLPATRLGDSCTGHGCFPPRPSVSASPNVFVDGIPWHRQGDAWSVHCCGLSCHASVLAQGSSTVFVNKIQAGRISDPVACGSVVMTGSSGVFAGG